MQKPTIQRKGYPVFLRCWETTINGVKEYHNTWHDALSHVLDWQQVHDWCPICEWVTLHLGEYCHGCGRQWGYDTSEYIDKRDQLAKFLCDLAYAPGMWEQADADMRENYTLDAVDVIAANPHLLTLPVRLAVLEGKSLEQDEQESKAA